MIGKLNLYADYALHKLTGHKRQLCNLPTAETHNYGLLPAVILEGSEKRVLPIVI